MAMTIEERVAALERTIAHYEETSTKKALPKLQAAMKDLEEASVVTAHLSARQSALLKDHAEWLHSHDLAMAEIRKADADRGRALDERIDKLVSAIGELLRTRNGKAEG